MNLFWRVVSAFSIGLASQILYAQELRLEPLTTFGPNGDGTLRAGDRPYLTSDGNRYQRGMAYNPMTGNLLIVNRTPSSPSINVVHGATGDDQGTLDLSALVPGGNPSFPINLIGVGEDGAIYVGNLSNQQLPPEFRLYRWQNEIDFQRSVFAGDPSNGNTSSANQRWGDTMAVRGSGNNTEILIASRGTLVAILRPTDETMTSFTSTPFQTDTSAGALGYGLAFASANTFYGTEGAQSGGPLLRMQVDGLAGTATTLNAFTAAVFPGTVSPIAFDPFRMLLAGIDIVPGADLVRLYAITNVDTPPVFLDRESFPTANANTVFAGALAFGEGRLYALDSDNGIMAFDVVTSSAPVAAGIYSQPTSQAVLAGTNATFIVRADGTPPLSYQWRFNDVDIPNETGSTLTISNVQTAQGGNYSVLVSNVGGPIISSNALLTVITNPGPQLVAYDPFEYEAGNAVNGQGGWVLNSGTSATVEPDSLGFPGLQSARGNRIWWGAASMSLRLPLNTNITSGSVYYSFAMSVEDFGGGFTAPGVMAGFTTGTTTSFGTKVDIRTDPNGGFNLGTSKPGAATLVWSTNQYFIETVLFIVGRYTFMNPGSDVSELWINPDAATFGAESAPAPTLTTSGGTDLTQIDRFFFRAGGATSTPAKLITDELRVGFSWASVTPVTEKPTVTIRRSASDVIVSWPASHSGFMLESSATLPDGWAPVNEPVVLEGDNNTVTIEASEARAFFRLTR